MWNDYTLQTADEPAAFEAARQIGEATGLWLVDEDDQKQPCWRSGGVGVLGKWGFQPVPVGESGWQQEPIYGRDGTVKTPGVRYPGFYGMLRTDWDASDLIDAAKDLGVTLVEGNRCGRVWA